MTEKPTLYLMVGLPGSGKTTRAKELEQETRAVRFTPTSSSSATTSATTAPRPGPSTTGATTGWNSSCGPWGRTYCERASA